MPVDTAPLCVHRRRIADKLNYKPSGVSNLVLATVGSADAHATLLVHGVQAAVGVAVVVLGVPDGKGVPAGHRVL